MESSDNNVLDKELLRRTAAHTLALLAPDEKGILVKDESLFIRLNLPTIGKLLSYGLEPQLLGKTAIDTLCANDPEISEKASDIVSTVELDEEARIKRTRNMWTLLYETAPQLVEMDFNELSDTDQWLLWQAAFGRLELPLEEDYVEFVKTSMQTLCRGLKVPVSSLLGYQGTIIGYQLDMASAIYVQYFTMQENKVLYSLLGMRSALGEMQGV